MLSFVMLLLSAGVTIIGWAIVICLVLVGVRLVMPYLYGKLRRIRVYYETNSGEIIPHSFKAEDIWHLWRMRDTMMIGRSGNRYYFCGGHTPEDARKELEKAAAIRAAERADEHERRPRWSLSERLELPGFEATYRMVDITFKLFQWLAFAGILRYFGQKTSDRFVSAIGIVLAIAALLPYTLLICEYGSTRIIEAPGSSSKYFTRYLLIAAILMTTIAYVFLRVSWHLLDDVLPNMRS